MVDFERYVLNNGLKVILHKDETSPLVTINVLYDVGSKDEDADKTGFAHLFEHLMFGGTPAINNYDDIAQRAGASNNAFTSNDLTNYYITLPTINMETGLMLEADRMQGLLFSPESLEVQRKVVIEEFKQRYLNKPYGDIWLELSPLAYKTHPYLWTTIGKKIAHIEEASLEDVKQFFIKHYSPANAILSVAGNIDSEQTKKWIDKWFGIIPSGLKYERSLPQEEIQKEKRSLHLERDVPQNSFSKVYHMPARMASDYISADLTSDLLGRGISSWFYQTLVKEEKLFTQIGANVTGSIDPGLFSISGMIAPEVSFEQAEKGIEKLIEKLRKGMLENNEVESLLNKVESTYLFNEIDHSNKAFDLAFFELLGDVNLINNEMDSYRKLTKEEIIEFASRYLIDENSSVIYYESNSNKK
jgi:predicted Zn-dependent peptidase